MIDCIYGMELPASRFTAFQAGERTWKAMTDGMENVIFFTVGTSFEAYDVREAETTFLEGLTCWIMRNTSWF